MNDFRPERCRWMVNTCFSKADRRLPSSLGSWIRTTPINEWTVQQVSRTMVPCPGSLKVSGIISNLMRKNTITVLPPLFASSHRVFPSPVFVPSSKQNIGTCRYMIHIYLYVYLFYAHTHTQKENKEPIIMNKQLLPNKMMLHHPVLA